jgi:hypothetical protein
MSRNREGRKLGSAEAAQIQMRLALQLGDGAHCAARGRLGNRAEAGLYSTQGLQNLGKLRKSSLRLVT